MCAFEIFECGNCNALPERAKNTVKLPTEMKNNAIPKEASASERNQANTEQKLMYTTQNDNKNISAIIQCWFRINYARLIYYSVNE